MLQFPQNHLRRLRLEYGLTLEQVSYATGISASSIQALENDRREVMLRTAMKLARFYRLPLDEIWRPLYEAVCRGDSGPRVQD